MREPPRYETAERLGLAPRSGFVQPFGQANLLRPAASAGGLPQTFGHTNTSFSSWPVACPWSMIRTPASLCLRYLLPGAPTRGQAARRARTAMQRTCTLSGGGCFWAGPRTVAAGRGQSCSVLGQAFDSSPKPKRQRSICHRCVVGTAPPPTAARGAVYLHGGGRQHPQSPGAQFN